MSHADYPTKTETQIKRLNEAVQRCSRNLGYKRRVEIARLTTLGQTVRIYEQEDPMLQNESRKARRARSKAQRKQVKRSRRANR